MNYRRIFLIVLDGFGVGALPDASDFPDEGSDTLKAVFETGKLNVPNMRKMGLFNISGIRCGEKYPNPIAAYGRCREMSKGKDTTVGHWEIAGLISEELLPTYPEGFPSDVIDAFEKATGRKTLCNKPYSGTDVINDFGEEHLRTGALIVYTSADSVFQIAAHEDIVPTETLYEYCRTARKLLCGKHSVGRVIARPFKGEVGSFVRTADRRDFSLEPYGMTMLDILKEKGFDVIGVGKISDIFAGRGITRAILSHGNEECMDASMSLSKEDFNGLCFINLVDFDMKYGHRNDVDGYAAALSRFDAWLPEFMKNLRDNDLLIITADHGCDPGDLSTDHTREYTPLLVLGKKLCPTALGTRKSFADISATALEYFGIDTDIAGESFYSAIGGKND